MLPWQPVVDSATPTRRALDDPPGGTLLWLIVALELGTFAIILLLLAVFRAGHQDLVHTAQQELSPQFGLLLTLVLVTSGACAAGAVQAFRGGRTTATRRMFFAAAGLGTVFLVLKIIDYTAHASAGHWLGTNDFWDAYVLATGFHFAHVLVGIVLMVGVGLRTGKAAFQDQETAIPGVALFWHMCDLVWFFLFPLFYAPAGT
jgi:nitric oxide reductase NorE protein